MSYSFNEKLIKLKFTSYEELLKANGTNLIEIKLIDNFNAESEYTLSASFYYFEPKIIETNYRVNSVPI